MMEIWRNRTMKPVGSAVCGQALKSGHAASWDNISYAAVFALLVLDLLTVRIEEGDLIFN